jgi:hypothetical protein
MQENVPIRVKNMKEISMKSLPLLRFLCVWPAITATIALAILLVLEVKTSEAVVKDSFGNVVILPSILHERDEQGPACLNDPSIWQKWIQDKASKMENKPMKPGYEKVAETFKKVSEEFKCDGKRISWRGALIQSILETGYYTFGGDAKPEHFNIAGVGITLDKGTIIHQDFNNLPQGIKAYYQHLCVTATGYELENPIAEYTRIHQRDKAEKLQNWRAKQKEYEKKNNLPTTFDRPITFNDLKAPITIMNKNSQKFKVYAEKWAGSVEDYEEYMKKFAGTRGTTLTWAGDPFYGVKQMSLWAQATKWNKDHCEGDSHSESSSEGRCSNWMVPNLKDKDGLNREAETMDVCTSLDNSGDFIAKYKPKIKTCSICNISDWTPAQKGPTGSVHPCADDTIPVSAHWKFYAQGYGGDGREFAEKAGFVCFLKGYHTYSGNWRTFSCDKRWMNCRLKKEEPIREIENKDKATVYRYGKSGWGSASGVRTPAN